MHGTSCLVVNEPRALAPQELWPRLLSSEKMAEGGWIEGGVTPRVLPCSQSVGLDSFPG